ncbi:MAG: rod shape-determining protein RodA [Spirochaetota bacterium]|nr:rod shape-determining protein RodA [Spirochaetota bacterium]
MIVNDSINLQENKGASIFQFDFLIFLSMILLMLIGALFIYSSGVNSSGQLISSEYRSQLVWIGTALLVYFLLQVPHYATFQKFSARIYGAVILLMIITLLFGKEVNGARSWLGLFGFGIQPSEFMKIALILMLASFYQYRNKEIDTFFTFVLGLCISLIPMLLVLLQPDMGTALVYIPIFLAISFVAGVHRIYLIYFITFGMLTILFAVIPVWERFILDQDLRIVSLFNERKLVFLVSGIFFATGILSLLSYRLTKRRYFIHIGMVLIIICGAMVGSYFFRRFLKDYQIMRLIVFIKPEIDPKGSGWNIIQSLTAVGSGGFLGKGFLQGTQSHYQFLPQQSTDFIFSIIAEEWGFVGSLLILTLFGIILVRGFIILLNAGDDFAIYTGTGILFMIFFHLVINIGMAVGIMPITGIPLFFLSYGGSSLWTATAGLALIQNIYLRRYKY